MIKGNEAESKNGSVTESQRKINMLKKQIVLVLFFLLHSSWSVH